MAAENAENFALPLIGLDHSAVAFICRALPLIKLWLTPS
jgi:hypothetical protein